MRLANVFQWVFVSREKQVNLDACENLVYCSECKEWVTETDIFRRKRKGKVITSKFCRPCGRRIRQGAHQMRLVKSSI